MAAEESFASRGFRFWTGRPLAGKYEVRARLGGGWEGEVYLVRERATGIERAAKFFYPERNPKGAALRRYARVLHQLQYCPILIRYHTQEVITVRGEAISVLVSDFVEGDRLSDFLRAQPGKRLDPFAALHLLHRLTRGIEDIHAAGEVHGDLHDENIIVRRRGLGFDLKLIDLYPRHGPYRPKATDDLLDLVRLLYDITGGRKHYARQPAVIKGICKGLRRDLILGKFRSVLHLRRYLETLRW
jgi:serine/threonine protein kinase